MSSSGRVSSSLGGSLIPVASGDAQSSRIAGSLASEPLGLSCIRPFSPDDSGDLWRILAPVIAAGETNALPRDMTREDALSYWTAPGRQVFVAVSDGLVVGTSYVAAHQLGGGAHVANAGYVTAAEARGRGVARALCAHSLDVARACGFRAMQFNFVVSTNHVAVRLWQAMGFAIVGRVPGAFAHPALGDVDVFVMHRVL